MSTEKILEIGLTKQNTYLFNRKLNNLSLYIWTDQVLIETQMGNFFIHPNQQK